MGNLSVTGDIRTSGNITAFSDFSDRRLKTKTSDINDALGMIEKLQGFYYKPNEIAHKLGIKTTDVEIGLSAQDVQRVLPELVKLAPVDCERDKEGKLVSKSGNEYLTVCYERLVPILVESIKELNKNYKNLIEEKG